MIIGIPKEIKRHEYRVAVTPSGVQELRKRGHTVLVEQSAGIGSGFTDGEYLGADADIVDRISLFAKADLIIKVKEPLGDEYDLLREGQAIFTYLHLAPNPELIRLLLRKNISAFAYETLTIGGTLPLLTPMSEVAGRMAPLMGAFFSQRIHGGTGVLPSGIEGVRPAKAVILGAGVVGFNAARVASGIGMDVIVLNRGIERLQKLDELFKGRIKTLSMSSGNIETEVIDADIVIGAVLIPGAKTPMLINRQLLRTMKKGAVIVDVSIDQGGCVETSRPTTHDQPVYEVDGIIHYSVANMPGAYPRTSTLALANATIQYAAMLADMGIERSAEHPVLKTALNIFGGNITNPALAESYGSQ